MDRRTFLATATAGAAATAPLRTIRASASAPEGVHDAYRANRGEVPWSLALRSVNRETLASGLTIRSGRVPEGLRGTFYRNGPARHELGDRRYHHWFDGDGMVHAFRFADGGVTHHGRYVNTPKHQAEMEAGRFLYPAFGTRWDDMRTPGSRDAMNAANISVLVHHERLMALWEGGSAHALDPDTLETRERIAWSPQTEGLPFSAHPSVDTDGTLWNFGVAPRQQAMVLYEIAPGGSLRRAQPVPLKEAAPMVHDFVLTQRHLVFVMPPLRFDPARFADGASFLDSHRWHPEAGMRVLVVDKKDWTKRRWFELPTGFVFHFGGGWDNGDTIRLDYERYPDPAVVDSFARSIMRAEPTKQPLAESMQVTLDLRKGTARQDKLAGHSEFPRLHPDVVGRRYRYRYSLTVGETAGEGERSHPFHNAVRRLDMETGDTQHFVFGPNQIAEEHIVVPKPGGGESDAWLIGTVLDVPAGVTRLTVFDARRLADGPILDAALPYALPLGLHGDFAAA